MDRAWTILSQSLHMAEGAVAFVLSKAILRILLVVAHHEAVAFYLGNNGSYGARKHFFIAFHNRFLRYGYINTHIPVKNQKINYTAFSTIVGIGVFLFH